MKNYVAANHPKRRVFNVEISACVCKKKKKREKR